MYDVKVVTKNKDAGSCTTSLDGVSAIGARVSVDGSCYTHVHPQNLDVVDASLWSLPDLHPGRGLALTITPPP